VIDLAEAWNLTAVASFEDRVLFRGMAGRGAGLGRVFSDRQLLDWQVFNNRRVTSFYKWVCDEINSRHRLALGTSTSNLPLTVVYGSILRHCYDCRR